jgi:septal ring factor EnvC (AmiA/AmiB activator)
MKQLVKVNDSTYVRDTESRAFINQDFTGREEYYAKVRLLTNQKTEINKVNTEINQMKSEMSEIKDLLKQLLLK